MKLFYLAFVLSATVADGISLAMLRKSRTASKPVPATKKPPMSLKKPRIHVIRQSSATQTQATKSAPAPAPTVRLHPNDLSEMWAGRDLPLDRLNLDQVFGKAGGEEKHPEKNVQIFGLPNTGTTLLRELLYFNFGRQLVHFDSKVQREDTNYKRGFDVHTNLKALKPDRLESINGRRFYALSVVRNPYSWLQVMRSDPDFAQCEILKASCKAVELRGWGSQGLAILWNEWSDGYLKATGKYGIIRHILIQYESLIRSPGRVMDRVGAFLNLETPADGWIIPFDSEESEERGDVLRDLDAERYMDLFSSEELVGACKGLSVDVQMNASYQAFACAEAGSANARSLSERT